MKKQLLVLITTTLFFNSIAYSEENVLQILNSSALQEEEGFNFADEEKLLAQVNQVYENYSQVHPACEYQPNPNITAFPQQMYTLTNPYSHDANQIQAIAFKIRNFIVDSLTSDFNNDPYCGKLSIKCASYVSYLGSSNYYCERIHSGASSDPALLLEPSYDNYLAYQTIYNLSVMPRAKKKFGLLKQFNPLDAFPPYSSSQIPNPSYEFNGVVYSTFNYPDPTDPLSPNFNNGNYGFLFVGSAENLKTVCQSIQTDNLSPSDAAVRISQFLGIPPDSPDVVRTFTFLKLRNNPHISGQQDGNMFRPCPIGGSIETPTCSGSALTIPHNCAITPAPYDGTTVSSFNANQYYSSYCNTSPNKDSGMPVLYPWTGQGFTYDWYPWQISLKNVQGTSEYIPAVNSGSYNIEVAEKKSLEQFLATCDFG